MRPYKAEYLEKIEQYINACQQNKGYTPSIYEMERVLGIPKTTVSRYLHYMNDINSFYLRIVVAISRL